MSWTPATLKARFAEFKATPDATVQSALDESLRRHDQSRWGDRLDDGVGMLAAHILAVSLFGQPSRLDPKAAPEQTTYMREWNRMARNIFGGVWTMGVYP